MFSDEVLERIFAHKELKDIPINEQSVMIFKSAEKGHECKRSNSGHKEKWFLIEPLL